MGPVTVESGVYFRVGCHANVLMTTLCARPRPFSQPPSSRQSLLGASGVAGLHRTLDGHSKLDDLFARQHPSAKQQGTLVDVRVQMADALGKVLRINHQRNDCDSEKRQTYSTSHAAVLPLNGIRLKNLSSLHRRDNDSPFFSALGLSVSE